MKIISVLKTLFVMCFIVSVAFLVSCDDDAESNSEVSLLSFGPAGVHHGESIKFIGTNLNQVTSIVLPPAVEITSANFASQSSELIELVIPDAAEAGIVTLKTMKGEIQTKTPLNFDVDVEITAMTPEVKPGKNLTITGPKVGWIEEVIFTKDLSVKQFVSKSLNEIVVTVPMAAETGFLAFKSGGTDPLSFASSSSLTVTLPAVTALTPSSVKHLSNLTISGTNLDLVKSVIFAGDKTVTAFESQTETEIVVKVPVGALKGKLTLTQTSPVKVVTNMELTITLPVGTSVAPQPAVPGTDDITITGTNLDLVSKLSLAGKTGTIEVLASQFKSQTATQIVLALPANADNGGISYTTVHGYSTILGVNVIIPGAGPPPLAITMFDDQVYFGGGNWSWGATTVTNSTEQFYSGTKSWKHTNTGTDGGASVGGMTGVNASGKTSFKFSLYGGPGTDNKQVAAILNDNWGNYNSVVLKEGKWTEFSIPVTSYPGVTLSSITRWTFKLEGAAAGMVVYVDRVGFD